MNYRHAYHAGNFADVVKHVALTAILLHLLKKETPFAVIDSHAGRGSYDLSSREARKTGEAAAGIEKLRGLQSDGALGRYLEIVGEGHSPPHARSALAGEVRSDSVRTVAGPGGGNSDRSSGPIASPTASEGRGGQNMYPGSPLIAAKLLRPQDRLVAIEKHPSEFAALKQVLAPWRKARAEAGDGYANLPALLPPPERRGLVLIDPPFEAEDEFALLAEAVRGGLDRFAHGIYLIWFPVKSVSEANRFCGEVLAAGVTKMLRIDMAIAAAEGRLTQAALLIVNPPFGFDKEMRGILNRIAPLLAGEASLEWLAGESR